MSNDDKIFADGFIAKRNDNAPDFVICGLSVNVESARETFKQHTKNGWLNLQIKRSQGGKLYVEVDTWEPKQQSQDAPPAADDYDDSDSIPF